jgi:hypothetical protein
MRAKLLIFFGIILILGSVFAVLMAAVELASVTEAEGIKAPEGMTLELDVDDPIVIARQELAENVLFSGLGLGVVGFIILAFGVTKMKRERYIPHVSNNESSQDESVTNLQDDTPDDADVIHGEDSDTSTQVAE